MSAALLTKLIEAGTPADLVAEVAMELAQAQAAADILEKRKEKDRERKRELACGGFAEARAELFGGAVTLCCTYCGEMEGPFHADHVQPLSKGGTSDLGNLVIACWKCNISKGAKTPEEWLS